MSFVPDLIRMGNLPVSLRKISGDPVLSDIRTVELSPRILEYQIDIIFFTHVVGTPIIGCRFNLCRDQITFPVLFHILLGRLFIARIHLIDVECSVQFGDHIHREATSVMRIEHVDPIRKMIGLCCCCFHPSCRPQGDHHRQR